MPPPNVTGNLHAGHALTFTIQDCLARHMRLRTGAAVLLPGLDHAGIATQLLVERAAAAAGRPYGLPSPETRAQKIADARAWSDKYGGNIIGQLKSMGVSADWSRVKFTLDVSVCTAVTRLFVRLHRAGVIFRGERLVNWDVSMQTAVSDLEVVAKAVKGKMYTIKYYLHDDSSSLASSSSSSSSSSPPPFLLVATTRPETIFGDCAVAVNPSDASKVNLFS